MFKMYSKSFLFFQCILFVYAEENIVKLTKRRLYDISNTTFAILQVEDLQEVWLINCDIRYVHENSFQNMRMLNKLRLKQNKISELHIDTFSDNKLLKGLDLSNNNLRRIDDGLFKSLRYIEIIDLSDNYIEFIGEQVFHNLQNLNFIALTNNRIASFHGLQFKDNLKLSDLQLSNNLISDLNFMPRNLISIKKILLDANNISQLKPNLLFGYPNLETVSFTYNTIQTINSDFFSKNLKLKSIDLSDNLINEIKAGLFSNLNHLETLLLVYNKISHIEDGVFPNTTTLRLLNLNGNELVYLNASIIKPLQELHRQGIGLALNPWICDCDLQELYKEWKIIGNPFIAEPTCDGPIALKGKEWIHLNVEDFHCDENEEIDEMVTLLDNTEDSTTEEFAELIETLT